MKGTIMLSRIPSELFRLYSHQGLRASLYAYLRWRLCPFEEIESHIPREGKIIDVGCGYGLLANFLTLRSRKRDVTGVDLSTKRIKAAQKTTDSRRNIRFKLVNVFDVELREPDAVVMSDFLHHLDYQSQEEVLTRCHEKLSPGGFLVCQDVDNRPRWKYWFAFLIDRFLNIGKRQFFRPHQEFRELLQRIGFSVKIKKVDKHLPLSDILFICKKEKL